MPPRNAARFGDPVTHVNPPTLSTPGPGSPDVFMEHKKAWRGVDAAAAAAIQNAKRVSDAAVDTAVAAHDRTKEALVLAAGTPGLPAAQTAEKTADAAEQLAKTTALTAGSTLVNSLSMGADIHFCRVPSPSPPHGPGVVIDGSTTVFVNGKPACRKGDTVLEPLGPPNPIKDGCPTVFIGDAQPSSVMRISPAGSRAAAQASRREVMEKYGQMTATDFTGIDDPRLREIGATASQENEEVAQRLREALERAGVEDIEVQFRGKSLKSILGKLQETPGMKLKDIKDLSGIRVNITQLNETNFAQYNQIKSAIQEEFGIPDAAIKDYNAKPNPWGYTGRIHLFDPGEAGIYSEIQVGSKDLSAFIEKKFKLPGGSTMELHDLTGYKGQLYGKAIPPELQTEYTALIKRITDVNKSGTNLAQNAEAQAEVDAYFAKVQAFLGAP